MGRLEILAYLTVSFYLLSSVSLASVFSPPPPLIFRGCLVGIQEILCTTKLSSSLFCYSTSLKDPSCLLSRKTGNPLRYLFASFLLSLHLPNDFLWFLGWKTKKSSALPNCLLLSSVSLPITVIYRGCLVGRLEISCLPNCIFHSPVSLASIFSPPPS